MFPVAGLNATQQSYADVIFREFAAVGYPPEVGAAAVVNAYAESALNPSAIGDGGKSVGLFQLHEKGGGAGLTTAQRQDPVINTRRIIEEAGRAWGFRAIAFTTSDIPTLAAAFSTYVERPSDKAGEETRRRALAQRLFPNGTPTTKWYAQNAPTITQPPADARSTYWWVALAALAIVSVATLLGSEDSDHGGQA